MQECSSTMEETTQDYCPLCMKKRINSKMKAMQINMQEAVWVCENENHESYFFLLVNAVVSNQCIWPVGYQDLQFISRLAGKEWSFHWNEDKPKNVVTVKPKEVDSIHVDLALYTPPVTPSLKDTLSCDTSNTTCNNKLNNNDKMEIDNLSHQPIGTQSLTNNNFKSELPPRLNDNALNLSMEKFFPTENSYGNNLPFSQNTNDCVIIDSQFPMNDFSKNNTVFVTDLSIASLTHPVENESSITNNKVKQIKEARISNQFLEQPSLCKEIVARKPDKSIRDDKIPDLIEIYTDSPIAMDNVANYEIIGNMKNDHDTVIKLKNSLPIVLTEDVPLKDTTMETEIKIDQSPEMEVQTPQDHCYISRNHTNVNNSGLFKRKSSSKQYEKFSFRSIKKSKQTPPTKEANPKSITLNDEQPVIESSNSILNQCTLQPSINENLDSNNVTFHNSDDIVNNSEDAKNMSTLEDYLQECVDEMANFEENSAPHEQSFLTANISSLLDEYLTPGYENLTTDISDDWLISLLN